MSDVCLMINNKPLTVLGITIDLILTWQDKVYNTCRSISQPIGLLWRVRTYLAISARRLFINRLCSGVEGITRI